MSGSGNPLRQKMINMMYLVLTALLALNVSADILRAFGLVNQGLNKTNESYSKKTELTMQNFKKLYDLDPKKAQTYYTNAQKAKELASKMYSELETMKDDIAQRSEGWTDPKEKKTVVADQNLEVAIRYFIEDKEHRGEKLRNDLKEFEKNMKALANNSVEFSMNTQNPPKDKDGTQKTWEEALFEGVPSVAAITLLTKFQNDVRNAESEVTNYNFKQVGADEQHFDNLLAIVSPKNPSVYVGDKYEASVILGAYNSTQNPDMEVNGRPIKVEGGVGKYEESASGIGEKKVQVTIKVKDPKTGQMKPYTTSTSYQVFKGNATISADKMNMLYKGLENPVTIAVPGFRPDQITATATGAQLRPVAGQPGHYMINPPLTFTGTIKVSVSAKTDKGSQSMGSMEYRVRPVPKPEVLLGSKTGGAISRGELQTVSFLAAGLGESFAFEGLNYIVTKYTMVYAPRQGQAKFITASGNRISPEARAIFANAKPGDQLIFSEVTAKGPVGEKMVNGPSFTVR